MLLDKTMFQVPEEEKAEIAEEAKKQKAQYPMLNQDHVIFINGLLSALGIKKQHKPVFDTDQKIVKFPFLDEFWDRPGLIYVTEDEINRGDMSKLSARTKIALKNAYEQGRLYELCDQGKMRGTSLLLGWAGT